MHLTEIAMPRRYILASLSVVFLLAAGACASAGTAGSSGTKASSTRITKPEITSSSASTAYDVVSQLHPDWLRPSKSNLSGALGASQTSGTGLRQPVVLVYLDGVRFGGIEQLRSLSAASIMSIEFVDSNRVSTVIRDIGTTTPDAAIMVSTKQ
jgi:hypothetical protein